MGFMRAEQVFCEGNPETQAYFFSLNDL